MADAGVADTVGSTGDSYDNGLAETINGLHKIELIKPRKLWQTVDEVEIATAEWIDWRGHPFDKIPDPPGDSPSIGANIEGDESHVDSDSRSRASPFCPRAALS